MTDTQVSLVAGYCVVPDPQGHAVMCTTPSTMTGSQHATVTSINSLAMRVPRSTGPSRATMASALAAWRPDAVLTASGAGSPLGRYLIRYFGRPTVRSGQVLGWRVGQARSVAPAMASR